MSLFSFQGKVYLAERTAQGKPAKLEWVGNAPELTLQLATETTDKTESYTGNRLQIGQLSRGKTATLNLTLDEWTAKNLALALYGKAMEIAGSTVTAEPLPSGLAAGDLVRLEYPFASDIVLTADSTPLVLDTDYRIESVPGSVIEILTPQTGPVTATYEYESVQSVTMFTETPPERWLFLDGINTENGEPVLVDLYRCKFNPVGDLALITDEYGSLSLSGSVLYDALNARDANLGGYGRSMQKAS